MNFQKLVGTLVWVVLGVALLVLFTQLRYEWMLGDTEIPLTGQSLAVLIIGFCWPGWSGVLAIVLYVLLGGFGMPVFAEGAFGWGVVQGGSGGYLLGFIAAALYLRTGRYRKWAQSLGGKIGLMFLASIFILGFGFIRLVQMFGTESALDHGFWPLWPGALVKIVLAAIVAQIMGILRLKPWGK
jgi:biotin transport system substrate-specific component